MTILVHLKWYDITYISFEKFNSSKKAEPGKLAELELSIKIVVTEFTKYCERLVQIILSYLKKQSFEERNVTKIIPIIFPSLFESEVQDHYLIFHFFGITITMTWNVLTYSLEDDERQTDITINTIIIIFLLSICLTYFNTTLK